MNESASFLIQFMWQLSSELVSYDINAIAIEAVCLFYGFPEVFSGCELLPLLCTSLAMMAFDRTQIWAICRPDQRKSFHSLLI